MAYLGIDPKVAYSSYRNIDDISASFDGFATTFPLTVSGVAPAILPINEQQLIINVGGVPQQPDPTGANGFKLFAGNIVFSSAPSIGETFWGVILASANYISANTRFADGSANLPSITFASGVTTGIYSPGANQLAVATNGTGRLFVDASGRVLIGTSIATGNAKLQVNGDALVQSINNGPLAGMRNAIINGNFDIWQRGTSFASPTSSDYTADRWKVQFNNTGATRTLSRQSFALGQTDVPGEPTYFMRFDQSVAGSGGTFTQLDQYIESVRTFAGQQVTISFWAKAAASTTMPSVALQQLFGSGGSPSSLNQTTAGSSLALTTTWQKFSYQVTLPSISGKTLGTNNNDALIAVFFMPLNATFTIDIAQVQVEPGPVATTFERRPIGVEFSLCERYYEVGNLSLFSGNVTSGNAYNSVVKYSTRKRATPSVVLTNEGNANFSTTVGTVESPATTGFREDRQATGTGNGFFVSSWTASAEL